MAADAAFLIPGDLSTRTGGYGYDRRILELLPSCGIAVRHVALPDLYPAPTPGALEATATLIAAQPSNCVLLFDGLAYGVLPDSLLRGLGDRIVALVHHPLFLEAGIDPDCRDSLFRSEQAALRLAGAIVATSASTRDILAAEFGLPASSILVAEPGTDPVARARGTGHPLQLLAVGAVVPRKGYDLLVQALAPLVGFDWQLRIAGPLDRNSECVEALRTTIAQFGLGDRIELLGPVSDSALAVAYEEADVFVMSSLFEGYGMVLGEAMARGLPIVCTTGGACADTAPATAALKAPPGDVAALTVALRSIITDSELRTRMADESWRAGEKLPRWSDTARRVAEAIRRVGNERL